MEIDINTCTLQEAMDYAVQKIVAQGKQCMVDDDNANMCLYADGSGNHCAIGWLIDTTQFRAQSYEGGLALLLEDYPDVIPDLVDNNYAAFDLLQQFHDYSERNHRIHRRQKLASEFGIDTTGSHWDQWVEMGIETADV